MTADGVIPQTFKLQEWVDTALLLAYRLPREPLLSASIRLSVDLRARSLFGTRWPDWIAYGAELLTEGRARGELLPNVDPVAASRLLVGAWTGVQVVRESTAEPLDLVREISALFEMVLPNIAVPGVLSRLDTSPTELNVSSSRTGQLPRRVLTPQPRAETASLGSLFPAGGHAPRHSDRFRL